MNVSKKVNEEALIVTIEGRLDTSTAAEFESFMNDNLSK